jgi:cytochrome c peroxidase
MKRLFALVLVALFACGSKKSSDQQGSGTGSAGPTETGPRPSSLPQPTLPKLELADDAKRKEKIELGHALFFDERLSGSNDRACYSCHQNEDGNGGHDPIANGSGNVLQKRHSPVIWNVGYWAKDFYWDGRAKTLEDNIKGAWGLGNMAGAPKDTKPEELMAALDKKTEELLKAAPGYKPLFEAAYPGAAPKAEQAIGAIAEYMRTLVCNDTRFDKFAAGDKAALSEAEQRGLDVFLSPAKGNCILCHTPPFFTGGMGNPGGATFFNVGIGTVDAKGQPLPDDKVDIGRNKVSKQDQDWAAFKVPSLRNVARSAPYFHDGSVAKLTDAVKLMVSGGIANKNKFSQLLDRKLSDAEIADLVAFFSALDCPGKLEKPKLP